MSKKHELAAKYLQLADSTPSGVGVTCYPSPFRGRRGIDVWPGLRFYALAVRQVTFTQARVVEWQTRGTQNPVPATACEFDSHLGHRCEPKKATGQSVKTVIGSLKTVNRSS